MSAYPWPAKAEPLRYATTTDAAGDTVERRHLRGMARALRRSARWRSRHYGKYIATTPRRRVAMLTPAGREAWHTMHAKPAYTYGDAAFWRSFGCLFLWGDAEAILNVE